ncbi:MAG TPA: cobyrinic acid a,c-diamide synthase, partial [Bacillota bacterium]|nr:cobyrinic acid a,c-diamide synthase [Bacillota bacterium]
FNFYYPENLELLESYGAELVFFSPLAGEPLPDGVDGLYIGGGFPEEFAGELARNVAVKESISRAIRAGLPTLVECGGYMYLTEEIVTTEGEAFPMVGVVPGKVTMQKRLAALGYREVRGTNGNFLFSESDVAKGHEFHYSTYTHESSVDTAYVAKGLRGTKEEGFVQGNLVAGYTHLHFGSNPQLVRRWIDKCMEVKHGKSPSSYDSRN